MGRFVTPSKVVILILARLYLKNSVPFSGTTKVLDVLMSKILPDASDRDDSVQQQDGEDILDLEKALAREQSAIPGRSIWDLLLKDMWTIDCVDALDDFITQTPLLLGKTREDLLRERDEGVVPEPAGKVVRTSPLGTFIRRCSLEYVRLQFQDSVALWTDFVAYRMPSKAAFTRRNPHALHNAFDVNLADLDIDISHPLASLMYRSLVDDGDTTQTSASTYDVEKLMEFQVSEMQGYGGRLPETMKTTMKRMTAAGASAPKLAHYLAFLDSWRAGDFTSAFDNLHRYFDYTIQARDRTFYQYALLNLAILQADFGCYDEAIPAMQEAISTARENRDTVCLNYCMSWLYHFGRAFPSQMQAIRDTGILANESEGLNFLKSRAKEAEMWTLLSTSHLSEAKLSLQHGESIAVCFENIVKAAHINIIKAVPNSTGPALLMKTALFSRIGQTRLAQSSGERFLLCHSHEAPLEDTLKCTTRQAGFLAQMGRLYESERVLASIPSKVTNVLKYRTYHTVSTLILRARRLLHRDNLTAASHIVGQLVSQQPHSEVDTSTQVSLLEIDLLIRQREFLRALEKIEILADKVLVENNDVLLMAKLLTLKAQLYAKSDKAHQGFSLAMRAVHMSYRSRVLPAMWDAVLALSHILNASYEFAAARDLLTAALPHVLECLDCDIAGRCYMLLADAYMGLAGLQNATSNGKQNTEVKLLMSNATDMLEKAAEQLRWIEELEGQLEILAKLSAISSWRGDTGLAAEIGDKYMSLKNSYASEQI
ncbi:APC5 protein [Lithohypha guttulata]|nr:APC5 protein [Lithohypha guttulata]